MKQSPISIVTTHLHSPAGTAVLPTMTSYLAMDECEVKNAGHGLQVDGSFGNIAEGGDTYEVLRYHMHFPSEHAVDGLLSAGKLHVVHCKIGTSGLDDLLVSGLMYDLLVIATAPAGVSTNEPLDLYYGEFAFHYVRHDASGCERGVGKFIGFSIRFSDNCHH
jgi:hypothetical protein